MRGSCVARPRRWGRRVIVAILCCQWILAVIAQAGWPGEGGVRLDCIRWNIPDNSMSDEEQIADFWFDGALAMILVGSFEHRVTGLERYTYTSQRSGMRVACMRRFATVWRVHEGAPLLTGQVLGGLMCKCGACLQHTLDSVYVHGLTLISLLGLSHEWFVSGFTGGNSRVHTRYTCACC